MPDFISRHSRQRNLIASILYDPSKYVVGKLTDNLFWKKLKAKHQLSESQNDFLDRYAEAVVEFAKAEKPKHVLKFLSTSPLCKSSMITLSTSFL
ncbi:MAG: hypothetical protein R2825_16030 [Saprospiraceae bacterium]